MQCNLATDVGKDICDSSGDKASRGPGGTQTRECGAVAHNTHLATANCLTTQTEWSGKCTWSDSPCDSPCEYG